MLNEALFRQIATQKSRVVFEYSPKAKKLLYVSQGVNDIWGFDPGQDTGTLTPDRLVSIIHPSDLPYLKRVVKKVIESERCQEAEFRLVLSAHQTKWVQVDFYPLDHHLSSHGLTLGGVLKDITIAKKNHLHLLDVNERKNMALQILGHDLRNPLAAIEAASFLLQRSWEANDRSNIDFFIASIKHACQKSQNLIRNVITSELLESKEVSPLKVRFDLVNRVQGLVDLYKLADGVGKKTIHVNMPESLFVEADEVKLMLCIENLISNALKFTKDDGNIFIRLACDGSELVIEVADDGVGIPEEQQEFIFDKFTIAARKGLHGQESLGLGLHIIKKLVQLHDGKIRFTSHETGTTFTIIIPQ